MSRSCKQHLSYIPKTDCIQCKVHGIVDIRQCSGCPDFQLNRVEIPPERQPKTVSRQQHIGTIGTRLATIITRETGATVHCTACDSEIARLNLMPKDMVLSDVDTIAERIVDRGASVAEAWWQRWGCALLPSVAKLKVSEWVREAANPFPHDGPATSTIRHLTYHVWPRKGNADSWKWNIERLAARWSLFNGIKCLGIVFDHQSESPEAVTEFMASLGIVFDHVIERQNNPQRREVETWIPMIEFLKPESAGFDEVVFSAHAKGVRHDAGDEPTRKWADVMYRTCLDDWTKIESDMSKFVATGPFKRYGNFSTPGNHNWHYSGTFFWWRLRAIGIRDWRKVDQTYFGSESWIGHQCAPDETGCLFVDNCGDLYKPEYWNEEVNQEWSKSSWAAAETCEAMAI